MANAPFLVTSTNNATPDPSMHQALLVSLLVHHIVENAIGINIDLYCDLGRTCRLYSTDELVCGTERRIRTSKLRTNRSSFAKSLAAPRAEFYLVRNIIPGGSLVEDVERDPGSPGQLLPRLSIKLGPLFRVLSTKCPK